MPSPDHIPREIFEIIFDFCVGFDTPVRDLVTLQLVCRTWHDIIAETSFLWGIISTKEGSRAFHKAFRLAKNSPLDLIFTDVGGIPASTFFSLTGEKIDQWRSLRLIGTPVNLTPFRLSGLKSLLLQEIPITAAELIHILADSPTLETLELSKLKHPVLPTEPTTWGPILSFHSTIQLSFLTQLKLDHLPFLSFFLSNLVVPRLRLLKMIATESITLLILVLNRHHLSATLTSVTSGAQEYEVTLRTLHNLHRCAITIGGLSIDFAWPLLRSVNEFQDSFNWLCDHLRGVVALTDIPLHLTLEGNNPGLFYLKWFTCRTNVTWLTVSNKPFHNYDLMDIISSLGRPTSGSSQIWLLPQLEVFETDLACTEGRGLIVDMIKARHHAVVSDSSPGLYGAFPNRFRETWLNLLVDMIEAKYAVFLESFPGVYGASPKRFREIRLSHDGSQFPIPSPLDTFVLEVIQAADGAEVYWGQRKRTELRDTGSLSINSVLRRLHLLPRALV